MVPRKGNIVVSAIPNWSLLLCYLSQECYLPGKNNIVADSESRELKDRSDWMLNKSVFSQILDRFPNLNVDLFASHLTFQLPCFFSCRPDPLVEAVDAFLQDWRELSGYDES